MFKKIMVFLPIIVSVSFLSLPIRVSAQQVSVFTPTAIQTSVKSILDDKDYYNQKEVLVEGKVTNLKFKTSKKGNDYANFYLSDDRGNSVRVFIWGRPPISEGDVVKAEGTFYKVKYVGKYRFYDEIDATNIEMKR